MSAIDPRDSLIAKQQIEIEDKRTRLADIEKAASSIIMSIVGISCPLNDNVKGYNQEQLKDWHRVLFYAEEIDNLARVDNERD